MAKIGNWGSAIKFYVKTSSGNPQIQTFHKLSRNQQYRVAKHSLIGSKPKLEGLGLDLQDVTMTVELNAMLGVKPRKMEEAIRSRLGEVYPLVVGGKSICPKAMLTKVSSSYEKVMQNGKIISMQLDLSFIEYN